jgi:hypothetical protein
VDPPATRELKMPKDWVPEGESLWHTTQQAKEMSLQRIGAQSTYINVPRYVNTQRPNVNNNNNVNVNKYYFFWGVNFLRISKKVRVPRKCKECK